MTYDEIKVEKLRDFVSVLELGEEEIPGNNLTPDKKQELIRRVKAQILWLEDKIEKDRLVT